MKQHFNLKKKIFDIYQRKWIELCNFYFGSSLWVSIKSRNLASITRVKIFTKPPPRQRTWQNRFRVVIVIWAIPRFYIWKSNLRLWRRQHKMTSEFVLVISCAAFSGCWIIRHYMKAGVRLERPHNLWTGTGCSEGDLGPCPTALMRSIWAPGKPLGSGHRLQCRRIW